MVWRLRDLSGENRPGQLPPAERYWIDAINDQKSSVEDPPPHRTAVRRRRRFALAV